MEVTSSFSTAVKKTTLQLIPLLAVCWSLFIGISTQAAMLLQVDFQQGSNTQTDFDAFTRSGNQTTGPQSEDYLFGTTPVTVAIQSLLLNNSPSTNAGGEYRERVAISGDFSAESNLLRDMVKSGSANNNDPPDRKLRLTLTGLNTGIYTITTYHHDSYAGAAPGTNGFVNAGTISIWAGTASAQTEVVSSLQQSFGNNIGGGGANSATVASATFQFSVTTGIPAVLEFRELAQGTNAASPNGTNFEFNTADALLNGFVLVPEPSTSLLLMAAFGVCVWIRRRSFANCS